MKVLGILGSPRIKGNSDILLDQALKGARDAGARVEKIPLVRKKISGCIDCKKCNKTGRCVIDDDMQEILPKVVEADAIVHSCPVYFWSMTSQMKAYLDRWCSLFDAKWDWHAQYAPRMKGKRVGLITVCGDPHVSTADPVVHSFVKTVDFGAMTWLGLVQASAAAKGEIAGNEAMLRKAHELGRKAARP